MQPPVKIPTYHSKDLVVLFASMFPMAIVLNFFLYGSTYFNRWDMFIWTTLASFVYLGLAFLTYGFVAISLRNRFPDDRDFFKRLAICLSIFYLMSAVYISLILIAYDYFSFYGYQYNDSDFTQAYIAFIVINTFLTFLNEGLYRFERYRATITENEQLKKEYMHSQLLGLKSQMNPHFLFNSLNTLSSLINEDAEKAEDFLDHMSKVYRYLLRNNEEKLVTVDTEIAFIESYYFLLKARHSGGLELEIDLCCSCRCQYMPPLTLQMILENTLNLNSISRSRPLRISLTPEDKWLRVQHNIQPRMNATSMEWKEAVENISNKYRLLCHQEMQIIDENDERIYLLPLIPNPEMSVA
jgi:hypothetical protein